MELDDAAVVEQVRAGDKDAFRILVERHSRAIFSQAFRMTHSEQDAEEIVQETFLRAYRGLGRFESRAAVGSWLYRIASNCALDLLSRRHRQPQPAPVLEDDDPPEERLPGTDPGPERLLISGELQERLEASLGQLSPSERVAFTLRHFEGRSIEEISRILDVRAGAAKNSIFRAVKKLRRDLAPWRSVR
jgi:RNA polymerase sigma-70 factor, ECF subfamily